MEGFTHRAGYGVWINDVRSEALRIPNWPCMIYDDITDRSLRSLIDTMARAGYNELCLWGLLNSYSWTFDFSRESEPARVSRVRELISYAQGKGIRLIYGLGVYSWGCDEIIRRIPEVRGTNPHALCGSSEESFRQVCRIIDFLFHTLDVDGVHLESADLGRCMCEKCAPIDNFFYHCALNRRVAEYIRKNYPDQIIMVNLINWQPRDDKLTDPDDPRVTALAELSRSVDYIIDPGHLGHYVPMDHVRQIAGRLHCDFGTAGGTRTYFYPEWERLRTFLPFAHHAHTHLSALYQNGGHACEYYTGPLVNPASEFNTAVAGRALSRPWESYRTLAEEALDELYRPRDAAAMTALYELFDGAEDAWFDNWDCRVALSRRPPDNRPTDCFRDFDAYRAKGSDAMEMSLRGVSHLENYMPKEHWARYREALSSLLADAGRLMGRTQEDRKIARIIECLRNTVLDLSQLEEYERWK